MRPAAGCPPAFKRYYYLTTDERTGDLMQQVADVDQTLLELDPLRQANPANPGPDDLPARVRLGPDWLALVGNWMTAWERTGDTRGRNKILPTTKISGTAGWRGARSVWLTRSGECPCPPPDPGCCSRSPAWPSC